jgi:hypothetical protein
VLSEAWSFWKMGPPKAALFKSAAKLPNSALRAGLTAAPRSGRSGKFRAHKEPDLSTELRHDRFATTAPCVVNEPRFCPGDTTVTNDNRKRGNASGGT